MQNAFQFVIMFFDFFYFTGLAPEVNVMCRRTLTARLHEQHNSMITSLKDCLKTVRYVCITTDCWSAYGKGYLGVTCHWIDVDTLTRQSAALACRRLLGSHTFDKLAEALTDVFNEFELTVDPNKIVCCVTDNGSNFTKAFSEFGLDYGYSANSDGKEEEAETDEDTIDADGLPFDDVDSLFDANSDNTTGFVLPPHHRCCSHTLSLIAVTDSQAALSENASYKRLHNATMAKCSAIWNSASRSQKSSEAVDDIIGRRLVKPCPTRWNSLYDAMHVLHEVRANLNRICEAVNVAALKDPEIKFIEHYITVMSPIATALDLLQSEQFTECSFMGAVLHTLLTVKEKLVDMSQSTTASFGLAHHLARGLLGGLERRFSSELNLESSADAYIVASISHPFFKLRWLPPDSIERCRALFLQAAIRQSNTNTIDHVTSPATRESCGNGFFSFTAAAHASSGNTTATRHSDNKIYLECAQYLENPSTYLSMLRKYPFVQETFVKYNTNSIIGAS